MKQIINNIELSVLENRQSGEQGLSLFLDYLIDLFDIRHYNQAGGFEQNMLLAKQKDKYLFNATVRWLELVTQEMDKGKWIDVFGLIYEEMYQYKGKAKALGQFFTPPHICDLMARITCTNEVDNSTPIGDCACGSARILLAAFNIYKKGYYIGEDIDMVSVKMAALNMMIHGMRGRVMRHDTLREPCYYDFGFELNEIRYPFPTPYYSLRVIQKPKPIEPVIEIQKKEVEQLKMF